MSFVQYSFSPGEITVNHLTGFYCSIFSLLLLHFFLQCMYVYIYKQIQLIIEISCMTHHIKVISLFTLKL